MSEFVPEIQYSFHNVVLPRVAEDRAIEILADLTDGRSRRHSLLETLNREFCLRAERSWWGIEIVGWSFYKPLRELEALSALSRAGATGTVLWVDGPEARTSERSYGELRLNGVGAAECRQITGTEHERRLAEMEDHELVR